jgi:cyanosortase A-associated protein
MTQATPPISKHQIFLATTLVGLFLTVLKLGLDPNAANRQPPNFSFPESVPIAPWQLSSSKAIAPQNPNRDEFFLDIHRYEYKQDSPSQALRVDMYYSIGSRGESGVFLAKRTEVTTSTLKIVQQFKGNSETGYYSLYSDKGRSYLLSCINPKGVSTVTSTQFLANRNKYDFESARYLPWVLGEESLRDFRCLWVEMSMPVDSNIAYPILEKVWVVWYQYWQDKFPKY